MTLPTANPQPDTPEARRYNRIKRLLELADLVLGVGFLVVLLVTGWTNRLRDISIHAGRDHYWTALGIYILLLSTISKLLRLGPQVYSFQLERRLGLSPQKFPAWIRDEIKRWVIGLLMGLAVAGIIYGSMRIWLDYWWILTWFGIVSSMVLLTHIAPLVLFPLFHKFVPLQNDELRARLLRLGERAGTRIRGVYECNLSEKTIKAEALLAGWGRTRRVVLGDTLLKDYNDDEIEAIMAHELGHHVHKHFPKAILMEAAVALISSLGANLCAEYVIRQKHNILGMTFQGLTDFANLPLLVLATSVISAMLMPVWKAFSRFSERQADLYCWKSVPSVTPFVTAMQKLSAQNLSENAPSRLVEVLFHSHPPVAKRIAAALSWSQKNRPSLAT